MRDEFAIEVRTEHGVTVLELSGELDLTSIETLEHAFAQCQDGHAIVVDLRRLEFIDSTGLRALITGHQRSTESGRGFALVKGEGQVERLLDLTGIADQLHVADSLEELLAGGLAAQQE